MRVVDFARYCRWTVRHPWSLGGLLSGCSLRDLVLRDELGRHGVQVSVQDARGLGLADLSVDLVLRLQRHLGARQPRTVLDVGAEFGRFAVASGLVFPGCRVFCFEPLATSFARLARSLVLRDNMTPFPFALGDQDGSVTIHRSQNPGSSSLLPMKELHTRQFPGTREVGREVVEVRRLDDLVASGDVVMEPPVILKIDVQGFEDRVLAGAKTALQTVDVIIVEMSLVPLYEGQMLFPEVRTQLEASGFSYAGEFDEIRSAVTGEVCQVDGFFIRV